MRGLIAVPAYAMEAELDMGNSAKHGGQERRITSEIKSGFEALPRQLAAQVAPQMNALLDEDLRIILQYYRSDTLVHPVDLYIRVENPLCGSRLSYAPW